MKPILGTQLDLKHPLNRGLVGCWLMNERTGATVKDISGNKNHGILQSTATWEHNNVSLNGTSDHIDIPNESVGNNFTAIISAYRNSSSLTGSYEGIFTKWGPTSESWFIGLTSGEYDFWIQTSGGYERLNTSIVAPNFKWLDIVLLWDGGNTYDTYVNGLHLKTQYGISGNIVTSSQELTIGRNNGSGNSFPGYIRCARLYNRALSQSEIKELYLAKFKPIS